MADISYELQRIMQAVYGEEVRGSIHDAIDKINQVGEVVLSEGTAVTSPTSPTTGFFDGSFYFNTETSDLWECTGTGWLLVGNLEGASIASIELTSTSGLVDTYTITLTNGNTSQFTVTNGYSPTVTIGTKVGRDQPVTFTDKDGSKTIHILDGQDGTASTLDSLTDVDLDTPTNNQFLRYNGTTQKWENSDIDTALSDTSKNPVENRVLKAKFDRLNNTTTKNIAITGWSSDTTSQSGTTLYKKQILLTAVYTERPEIDIGSSGVLPSVAEQEAYNLLQYVTVDDTVPCLYLYASAIPTTAFYINVKGVN